MTHLHTKFALFTAHEKVGLHKKCQYCCESLELIQHQLNFGLDFEFEFDRSGLAAAGGGTRERSMDYRDLRG